MLEHKVLDRYTHKLYKNKGRQHWLPKQVANGDACRGRVCRSGPKQVST